MSKIRICKFCLKEFNKNQKFCNIKCFENYKQTEQYKKEKKEIAIKNLSNYNSKLQSGEIIFKHSEQHKKYIGDLIRGTKRTESTKKLIKDNHWSKNDKIRNTVLASMRKNYHDNPEAKKNACEKMSITKTEMIANGELNIMSGICGLYFSKKNNKYERYQSLYELKRMVELDNDVNVSEWTKKHNIRLRYNHNHKNKGFVPDFLYKENDRKILEEVKSQWTYNKCGVDKELESKNELKFEQAKKYCLENNMEFRINFVTLSYEEQKELLNEIIKVC